MNTPTKISEAVRRLRLLYLMFFSILAVALQSQAQVVLTGLIQQGADQAGHSDASPIWQTSQGSSFAKIYVTQPNAGYTAPFLNSGNGPSTSISYTLTPGIYEFYFFAFNNSANNPGIYGLNLFFNGDNTNPGISAYSALNVVSATPVQAGQYTLSLNGDDTHELPATGSLAYTTNGMSVTLTGYGYGTPGTFGGPAVDRVGNLNSVPDGFFDAVGVFTLTVTSVPVLQVASATNQTILLAWNSVAGLTYQLQYTTSLAGASWTPLGTSTTATSSQMTAYATNIGDAQRFYRVLQLP